MNNLENTNFELSLLNMNFDKAKVVEFLKQQRKTKKINQTELAEKTGIFQQRISQMENLTYDFSIDEFNSWCNAMNLSPMQVIMYTHITEPLPEDLKIIEERKQKEVIKNEILEKIKDLTDEVKKL
jgi:transcriptional regulator with XRE-family HTH domain